MKVKTLKEFGNGNTLGIVFVQGLHGVPDYYKDKGARLSNPKLWFWGEGSKKEDLSFIHENVVRHGLLDGTFEQL